MFACAYTRAFRRASRIRALQICGMKLFSAPPAMGLYPDEIRNLARASSLIPFSPWYNMPSCMLLPFRFWGLLGLVMMGSRPSPNGWSFRSSCRQRLLDFWPVLVDFLRRHVLQLLRSEGSALSTDRCAGRAAVMHEVRL